MTLPLPKGNEFLDFQATACSADYGSFSLEIVEMAFRDTYGDALEFLYKHPVYQERQWPRPLKGGNASLFRGHKLKPRTETRAGQP